MNHTYSKSVFALAVFAALGAPGRAQTSNATLHGQVTDPSSSSIPGATVLLKGAANVPLKRTTDVQGRYTFTNIPAGKYTISVESPGFTPFEMEDYDVSGDKVLNIPMVVAVETQQVTVKDEIGAQVSVDPDSNAGALVLRGKDLDVLSDDPDELQDDLQALAGPSAGPNGGQIFIDGYSNGTLPPKSSIREVRINRNPFSAEYDRLGFGRIEIFTKPGTDKFHGQFMTLFGDNDFNARNPLAPNKPDFQSRIFDGNVSGPIAKGVSFTIDVEHRGIDDNTVIVPTVLDPVTLQPTRQPESVATPQERWHVVPRVDFQLTPKNTLTVRYGWNQIDSSNQGLGNFGLPSAGYGASSTDHTLQLTETAMLSPNAINETRFEAERSTAGETPNPATANLIGLPAGLPPDVAINVPGAFMAGNPQLGIADSGTTYWELQNMTSKTQGKHSWKFGGRLRASSMRDFAPANFDGTFTFNSLALYQNSLQLLNQGLTPAQLVAQGGGPTSFSITTGNPLATINQTDIGLYALDDWRLSPNFTLSYGVRYENQTNISDNKDFSPRLGIAWGIDGGAKGTPKTVLRAGFGIFYDRFDATDQLAVLHGINEQQYIVPNPGFFPLIPSLSTLGNLPLAEVSHNQVDPALRAPYIAQSAIGVDRQLPRNSTMSVTYTFSRGVHELLTRDINAPIIGMYPYANAPLPYGGDNPILQYESAGSLRQQQVIANFNTRFSRRITLFGFYTLNFADSNTDGIGTVPANPYNLSTEWGPARFDIRNRVFVGGSLSMPGRVSLSPFITASSGAPFNITDGLDPYGDLTYEARPALATPGTSGAITTPWGTFNPNPGPGDTIISRNYGRGPGQLSINLRLSRTWGFGRKLESASNSGQGGPFGGGSTFGGMRHGGGGRGGMFGDASTGRRYNLTLGVTARNVLNTTNLAPPIGNLLSPAFGQSVALAGGFGPSSGSYNRRIDLQLRLSF